MGMMVISSLNQPPQSLTEAQFELERYHLSLFMLSCAVSYIHLYARKSTGFDNAICFWSSRIKKLLKAGVRFFPHSVFFLTGTIL